MMTGFHNILKRRVILPSNRLKLFDTPYMGILTL